MLQVRNRFAASSTQGGYRDVNIKIRVGFRSDQNSGLPVFCPVYDSSTYFSFKDIVLCSDDMH
jgi:hypothetical protein